MGFGGEGPDLFEGDFGADVGGHLAVLFAQRLDDVGGFPEADAEVVGGGFGAEGLVEAAPADEEAVLGLEAGHDAGEFAEDADVEFGVLGLDLHDEARGVEAEGAAAGEDVDSAVDAGLGDAGAVALGLEEGCDELGHAVAFEALGDAVVDHGVGAVRGGRAGRGGGGGVGPGAAFEQGADPSFRVIAVDPADGHVGAEGEQHVGVERFAGDVRQPIDGPGVHGAAGEVAAIGVSAGHGSEGDGRPRLHGQGDEVADLHGVADGPDLVLPACEGAGLFGRVGFPQQGLQPRAACAAGEVGEFLPSDDGGFIVEGELLAFSGPSCAHQPKGHCGSILLVKGVLGVARLLVVRGSLRGV